MVEGVIDMVALVARRRLKCGIFWAPAPPANPRLHLNFRIASRRLALSRTTLADRPGLRRAFLQDSRPFRGQDARSATSFHVGRRLNMSSIMRLAFLLAAVCATGAAARGDGWKFWKSSAPTQRADGTVGGAPHMSGAPPSTSSSWSIGRTWGSVQTGTKKAWNKTVDVVTLKPLRTPKPQNDFKLGMHPDPRRQEEKKSWFGNPFGSKEPANPRTTDEFFSQPRVR
jgi:hypothetical protein